MKKALAVGIRTAFIIYCSALIYILLINGRHNVYGLAFSDYFRQMTNFIPFKTIMLYINAAAENRIEIKTAVLNLFGNLVLFLPMGIFLPSISKKPCSFVRAMLVSSVIIIVFELLQLLLMVGTFDIDDFILNIAGAALGFALTKIKFVRKFLQIGGSYV